MKKFNLLILFTLFSSLVFPKFIGTLPDVMKPQMLVVKGEKFYISEGAEFSIYSLKDAKLIKTFGKKGEGPGELIEIQHYPNKITVQGDEIFVTGIGKAITFSKTGEFIREFKTTQSVFQLVPAGKNFVAKEFAQSKDGQTRYMTIALYNSEMKKLKELNRQPWAQQQGSPGIILDMSLDFTSLAVEDNKIFIEKSFEGFLIDIYDTNGNKLYSIKKDPPKRKVTSDDRESLEALLRDDPQTKQQANRLGGWKEMKKLIKMEFPDHFPAIKGLEASGKKLYVRTNNLKDGKEEYIIMDLKGNILRTIYIPAKFEPSILALIAGGKLSCIENGNLYYLIENEDEEEWELHVEKL